MRIHFVYAGDPNNTANYAPYTITRHLYRAFRELADISYYDWFHCGPFDAVEPDDIIIGHPNYPDMTATRQLFKKRCRAKLLIFPFHHGMPDINFPFDDLARQADAILSITGPYWYDTIENTKFAHWKPKITRLDMAIDADKFPFVKTTFRPPGKRAFYYVGHDRPEKGVSTLGAIFRGTNHTLHLYGSVDGANPIAGLPNVHLHGWTEVSTQFAKDLAETADCLVHGGVSDANPTTLLEAASWGFTVACTPQSGYWPGKPFHSLNADDIEGSRAFLQYIQTAPAAELLERASKTREIVTRDFTWDNFVTRAVETVKRFL